VKKMIPLIVAVLVAAVVLVVTMVTAVNMKGGVSPAHAGLSKLPLIGKLIRINIVNPDERTGSGGPLVNDRPLAFLRPGDETKLAPLTRELERKSSEYDDMLLQLRRRARELDAWERQLVTERDNLKQKFSLEGAELTQRATDLVRKESDLKSLSLLISAAESENLKKTADIYGKMDVARAADVLSEMYSRGDRDSVIKIISLMDEGKAAKALGGMKDAKLCADITTKLAHVVNQPVEAAQPVPPGGSKPAESMPPTQTQPPAAPVEQNKSRTSGTTASALVGG